MAEYRVGPHGYIHGWIKVADEITSHAEQISTNGKGDKPHRVGYHMQRAAEELQAGNRQAALMHLNVARTHSFGTGSKIKPGIGFVHAPGLGPAHKLIQGHIRRVQQLPGPGRRSAEYEPPGLARDPAWTDLGLLIARTAETPIASSVHEPFGSPAGPGLFGVKGLQLPAYIQHVAHHLVGQGHPESKAIEMAVGIVRNWAEGHDGHGNAVHPDVHAAAVKAMAEWEAAKAAASKGRK